MVIMMNYYVSKLCSLGIPACYALVLYEDFMKNFDEKALDAYIEDLEKDSEAAWEWVPNVYSV